MRRLRITAFGLLTPVAMACTLEPAYDRSNPFDPGSPYPMRLVGVPDTVSSIGQRFVAGIERDPPVNVSQLTLTWGVWSLDADAVFATEVRHVGGGEFVSNADMSARLINLSVAARFSSVAERISHGVEVGKTIAVGQLVEVLNLSCASPCQTLPLAVGNTLQVLSDARDANGVAVRRENFAMQRALVTIRTAGILTPAIAPNDFGTYTFTATGAGSTWIVIRSDHAVDSVQVTVTP